jgi:hypothetical protein
MLYRGGGDGWHDPAAEGRRGGGDGLHEVAAHEPRVDGAHDPKCEAAVTNERADDAGLPGGGEASGTYPGSALERAPAPTRSDGCSSRPISRSISRSRSRSRSRPICRQISPRGSDGSLAHDV